MACANIISSTSSVALKPVNDSARVVDLVLRQGEPVCRVRGVKRGAPPAEDVDVLHRLGPALVEERLGCLAQRERGLGHAVVEERGDGPPLLTLELGALEDELGHALDAADVDAAVVDDVGCLACPRRDGSEPRPDHDEGRGSPGAGSPAYVSP